MLAAASLAVALVGPVTVTEHAAVSMTDTGRLAYVMAVECRRGFGWLYFSDLKQEGARKAATYALGARDVGSVMAATLCRSFNPGPRPYIPGDFQ